MNGLIRCQNGHLFSSRRYGTICPYCNLETAKPEKKEVPVNDAAAIEELLITKEKISSVELMIWIYRY